MSKVKGKNHPPYRKVKGVLREKELTYQQAADALGICVASLNHKINGKSDFTIQEAQALANLTGYDEWDLFEKTVKPCEKI